jgi:hypothetical protein
MILFFSLHEVKYYLDVRTEVKVDKFKNFALTHHYRSKNEIIIAQKKGSFIF